MTKLADETDGLAKAVERLEHDIRDQNTPNWPSKRTTVNTPDLHTILSALRRVEKLEAALEPFASAASVLEKVNGSIKDGDLINIEMGDLRAARQALTCEA